VIFCLLVASSGKHCHRKLRIWKQTKEVRKKQTSPTRPNQSASDLFSKDFDLPNISNIVRNGITMAADLPVSTQTPPPTEPKAARKKKAKAEAVAAAEMERKGSQASSDPPQIKANGEEASYESPYIKEIQK
jgi:hypothetical protein